MKSSKLVSKLIRGSEEIDQMKREINSVIHMVLGLIPPAEVRRIHSQAFDFPLAKNSFGDQSGDEMGKWEFEENNGEPYICCFLYNETSPSGPVFRTSGAISPHAEYVRTIHAGLPYLIEGLVKLCPELEKRMKPFIDAADSR
jgi:hypothetical protein